MSQPRSRHAPGAVLKTAIAGTVRAISACGDLPVHFVGGQSALRAGPQSGLLPEPSRLCQGAELAVFRGRGDSLAAHHRFHNQHIHHRYRPEGEEAQAVYDRLEHVRCEMRGASLMPGMAENLAALNHAVCIQKYPPGHVYGKDDVAIADALQMILQECSGADVAHEDIRPALQAWSEWLEPRAGTHITSLSSASDSQLHFARTLRRILSALNMAEEPGDLDEESDAQENTEETQEESGESSGEMQPEPQGTDAGEEGEPQSELVASGEEEDSTATSQDERDAHADQQADSAAQQALRQGQSAGHHPPYRIFTDRFDEVAGADTLCPGDELDRLRRQLDEQLAGLHGGVVRLANRLQRKLLARQSRSWMFDMEDGVLDCARLARIVVDPTQPLAFKRESESEFRHTVVTLLLDNSGSMRGRPIAIAAVCADILGQTLERCGVAVEILGFTTRAWKGGRARDAWVAAGKPENPGRLNDLRHIVYKSADMPWRRARRSLGLMLREGLLKENIDGEALDWAHSRLLSRPEQRRILMVISDGAPVDDCTLSVNPGNFLEQHLQHTIHHIEAFSQVELIAIGIGHDVTSYYRRAVTIIDAEELAGAMIDQLANLFDCDISLPGWRSSPVPRARRQKAVSDVS